MIVMKFGGTSVGDAARVRQAPNPSRLLSEFKPDGQRRVLAARVRGQDPGGAASRAAPEIGGDGAARRHVPDGRRGSHP